MEANRFYNWDRKQFFWISFLYFDRYLFYPNVVSHAIINVIVVTQCDDPNFVGVKVQQAASTSGFPLITKYTCFRCPFVLSTFMALWILAIYGSFLILDVSFFARQCGHSQWSINRTSYWHLLEFFSPWNARYIIQSDSLVQHRHREKTWWQRGNSKLCHVD